MIIEDTYGVNAQLQNYQNSLGHVESKSGPPPVTAPVADYHQVGLLLGVY